MFSELQLKYRCKVLSYCTDLAAMQYPISADVLADYAELPGGIGPYVVDVPHLREIIEGQQP